MPRVSRVWTYARKKRALAKFEEAVLGIAFIGTLELDDPRREDIRKVYARARKDMDEALKL